MFENQGNEIVIPSNVLRIEGKKGSVIADKLLGGFEVDSELPYKVFKALGIKYITIKNGGLKIHINTISTKEEVSLIKECLQELTEFGFGDFEIKRGN